MRKDRNSYKLDLRVGTQDQIELFSFLDPPQRPNKPESCGLRHLAFEVDDIDQSVMDLSEKGIEVEPIRLDEITPKTIYIFSRSRSFTVGNLSKIGNTGTGNRK